MNNNINKPNTKDTPIIMNTSLLVDDNILSNTNYRVTDWEKAQQKEYIIKLLKGIYLTKEDLAELDKKYQPIGQYALYSDLAKYQPVGLYATESELKGYQPVGQYALQSELTGYQPKTTMSSGTPVISATLPVSIPMSISTSTSSTPTNTVTSISTPIDMSMSMAAPLK